MDVLEPQKQASAVEEFNAKGYLVLPQALPLSTVNLIKEYYLMKKGDTTFYNGDPISPGRNVDQLSESMMLQLQPLLEEKTGRKLFPTYSYMRLYHDGAKLQKHVDRDPCEISTTVAIDYDAPKNWPICIEVEGKPLEVFLEPGDILIYKGREIKHWRNTFKGNHHLQVFLHYVDANGKFTEWKYHKRSAVGTPMAVKKVSIFKYWAMQLKKKKK